ncbi:uncharacterized protein EV422DRAFT_496637 [Fimicolochytrium jonesii]|uniref:uncharacterized protein n=1 Tax=Fimicolochytrium jonesii TaxID=1396493 RepID=UPI0022FDD1A3|nr:uncharacterized protein EV422DRAFT_496637 [Fimicolochytrium jonesii]KAI8820784.1 hypothetical protein EV422DRAFT_496637 [Fimicolochytrium jonesii]
MAAPTRSSHRSQYTSVKPTNLEPHHERLFIIVALIGVAVTAGDIYYILYMHEPMPATLSPEKFQAFKLQEIIPLTHDTSLFRFATHYPQADSPAGIPVPSHVVVKDDTCQVARSYTPITYTRTHFDLLVKKYEGGSVSKFLHATPVGDKVEMSGPMVTLPYEPNLVSEIGMIAGGTGITPMYQLIKRILRDPNDHTKISLIYANRSEDDIVLRQELELLATSRPDRLKVVYTIDQPKTPTWTGNVGFVNADMIKKYLPAPGQGTEAAILICGPDGLVAHVAGAKKNDEEQGPLGGILLKLGYQQRQVFKF